MRETSGNLKNLDKQDELHWEGQVRQLLLECPAHLNLSPGKENKYQTQSISYFVKEELTTFHLSNYTVARLENTNI